MIRWSTFARIRSSALGAILVFTSSLTAFGDEGRPVTEQDVSGKKICWDGGNVLTLASDHHFSNTNGHSGEWSFVSPGVVKIGNLYRQMAILADGRVQVHSFVGRTTGKTKTGGNNINFWGKFCD
jgi:hypothetical protein